MGKILRILVITGLIFLLVVTSVGCAPKATPAPTTPAATPAPAPAPTTPAATPAPAPTTPAVTPAPAPVLTLSFIQSGARVGVALTVAVDATYQLIINAIYVSAAGGGGLKEVTANSTYVSSNNSRATVTTGGLIRGIAVGAVNVTASYSEGGVTKTVVIPVTVN